MHTVWPPVSFNDHHKHKTKQQNNYIVQEKKI